jgi:hypothetical protein
MKLVSAVSRAGAATTLELLLKNQLFLTSRGADVRQ